MVAYTYSYRSYFVRSLQLHTFILLGYMGLICGCIWTDPQERAWQRQLSEEKPKARWTWETRCRHEFTGLPWPYTLSYNHDHVDVACIVARQYLLLVGTQRWEFYQPDNDCLYVIDLSSGELVREIRARYHLTELLCGEGQYAAYVGMQYDAVRRHRKDVLVIRSFPSGEQMDEVSIDSLGLHNGIQRVTIQNGLTIIEDNEHNVRYRKLADTPLNDTGDDSVATSAPATRPGTTGIQVLTPISPMTPAMLTWRDAVIRTWPIGVSAYDSNTYNLRSEIE